MAVERVRIPCGTAGKRVIRPPWRVPAAPFLIAFFDARTRAVVAGLWFVGVALASTAAILAALRPGAGSYFAFVVPAIALTGLGAALLRSNVWAMAISAVLLAGQIAGVLGTAWQLVFGIDPRKAAELRALGCDPAIGVAINLAFSSIATCVLAVALFRYARRARERTVVSPGHDDSRHF